MKASRAPGHTITSVLLAASPGSPRSCSLLGDGRDHRSAAWQLFKTLARWRIALSCSLTRGACSLAAAVSSVVTSTSDTLTGSKCLHSTVEAAGADGGCSSGAAGAAAAGEESDCRSSVNRPKP